MKAFIDNPLDELELEDVRVIRKKVKFPCKLDISVFYQLTRRSPHEELAKIGKKPNADLFPFMKGSSHQQTEEEIKFVFEHLGWSYSPIQLD